MQTVQWTPLRRRKSENPKALQHLEPFLGRDGQNVKILDSERSPLERRHEEGNTIEEGKTWMYLIEVPDADDNAENTRDDIVKTFDNDEK